MNRAERQRARLQLLVDEYGSQRALAEKVDTAPNYITQLLNSRNGIARKFCVRLEKATGKPDGWMDQWLPEETSPGLLRSMLDEVLASKFGNKKNGNGEIGASPDNH